MAWDSNPDDGEPDFLIIERSASYWDEGEDKPFWTWQRIAYAIVALLLIFAFLLYILYPALIWLTNPPPPPPTPPTGLI